VTQTSFHLPPTNIPLTNAPTYLATNYDRQTVTTSNGSVYVGWGDMRIREPERLATTL
jgi:hypothetical protein